jgi:hypothetical protein
VHLAAVYFTGLSLFVTAVCFFCLQESRQLEWQQFAYFLFLSSAVRGPFMPTYLQGTMHWADGLLQ